MFMASIRVYDENFTIIMRHGVPELIMVPWQEHEVCFVCPWYAILWECITLIIMCIACWPSFVIICMDLSVLCLGARMLLSGCCAYWCAGVGHGVRCAHAWMMLHITKARHYVWVTCNMHVYAAHWYLCCKLDDYYEAWYTWSDHGARTGIETMWSLVLLCECFGLYNTT